MRQGVTRFDRKDQSEVAGIVNSVVEAVTHFDDLFALEVR